MPDYKEDILVKANEIDNKIIEVLCKKKSFRVEAGAGSGKTYSLMKVIDWLQENKSIEYKQNGKRVACITYTNAAVDVINERLKENSFVVPSTIHSFAWDNIKQFQEHIIFLMGQNSLLPKDTEVNQIKNVQYTLGVKYFDPDGTLYLGHNDILKLFNLFLDNLKFQKILANKYPIILIDEYQDSNKEIVNKFIDYYISKSVGVQFGFFGDSWQTIYQWNGACGEIISDKLEIIRKSVNFRSSKPIVEVLNKIRSDLPQTSALKDETGCVCVISTNNYSGERRSDGQFKEDLPPEKLEEYVDNIKNNFDKTYNGKIKVLMLTHRLLATQQGYPSLFELLGDGLTNADDILLCYLRDVIFPLIKSINENDMIGICDILKISNYPIQKKEDKKKWSGIKNKIEDMDNKTIYELLSIFRNNGIISFPERILEIFLKMEEDSSEPYQKGTFIQLKNTKVIEFEKAIAFISPESQYSTEHGVKGEEYESVLFVIGRGWNQYQFDKWMPRCNEELNEKDRKSFERNRNLFYVCCSRAKKNLIILITIPLKENFQAYLEYLVGKENVVSYESFIEAN